jgi:hypothetical protein
MDATAESLQDVWISLNNEWRSARDVWLDANRGDFESSFWVEIEGAIRTTLDDFRRLSEAAERARQSLES